MAHPIDCDFDSFEVSGDSRLLDNPEMPLTLPAFLLLRVLLVFAQVLLSAAVVLVMALAEQHMEASWKVL